MYCRQELNVRKTANFLLAYAAKNEACKIYLPKYFSASVNLPSDWLEVVNEYSVSLNCLTIFLRDYLIINRTLCLMFCVRCWQKNSLNLMITSSVCFFYCTLIFLAKYNKKKSKTLKCIHRDTADVSLRDRLHLTILSTWRIILTRDLFLAL